MLLLVRHGTTASNERGHLLGRADPPLTARGQLEARQLASWLPRPDLVITSPLTRARQTAELLGADVRLDERWIELDYGPYDQQPASALAAADWADWRADGSFTPAGIEPIATLGSRVRHACEELAPTAAGRTVVVVTHVSPIKAAVAWALDVPDQVAWRMFVEDASVTRIDIAAGGPVLRWFNRTGP